MGGMVCEDAGAEGIIARKTWWGIVKTTRVEWTFDHESWWVSSLSRFASHQTLESSDGSLSTTFHHTRNCNFRPKTFSSVLVIHSDWKVVSHSMWEKLGLAFSFFAFIFSHRHHGRFSIRFSSVKVFLFLSLLFGLVSLTSCHSQTRSNRTKQCAFNRCDVSGWPKKSARQKVRESFSTESDVPH